MYIYFFLGGAFRHKNTNISPLKKFVLKVAFGDFFHVYAQSITTPYICLLKNVHLICYIRIENLIQYTNLSFKIIKIKFGQKLRYHWENK